MSWEDAEMALDRFVRFKSRRPTRAEIALVLINFFSGIAEVAWDEKQDRFYITLPGKPSCAFNGLILNDVFSEPWSKQYDEQDGRWIELYYDAEQFDVITRQQDEFTNVIARGIADMFARFWNGKVDE